MHLLDEEAEALADRLGPVGRDRLAEELEVRPEADDLLVDVPALREICDLPSEPVLVDLDLLGQFADRGTQPVTVRGEALRRARLDPI